VDKIIINAADPEECRVAMLDGNNRLQEYYSESNVKRLSQSNIYKGVIQNIEPSLQAVFVNYGDDRNGFLQMCDIHPEYFISDDTEDPRRCLRKGQPLLVQVAKEPTIIKGAALTTYISLAGRFVVLTPGHGTVGVSRKIVNDKERNRLRCISDELPVPFGLGYILRTVAENRTPKELAEDLHQVHNLWEDIRNRAQVAPAPSLIYREQDLSIKILRDHYNPNVREILVDDPATFQKVVEYIKAIAPEQQKIVKLHKEKRPIFYRHQLEEQIATIYQNNVKLNGGGSIVITPTEALVSIDVNSGKGNKEGNLEDTAFSTNIEAAEEITRQLRLRDLGGLVVIDFIDMKDDGRRRAVEQKVRESSKIDKAKMDFGSISKFGLLEMTRQRIRPSIESGSFVICPHCQGRGQVKTSESASLAAIRQITHMISKGGIGEVKAKLNPDVSHYLLNFKRQELAKLEERHGVRIVIFEDPLLAPSQSQIETVRKVAEAEYLKPGQVAGVYDDEDGPYDNLEIESPDEPANRAALPPSGRPGHNEANRCVGNGGQSVGHGTHHGPSPSDSKRDSKNRKNYKSKQRHDGRRTDDRASNGFMA
jgi:ribonuclease E